MAHGLANHYCKRRVYVESAGLIAGLLDGFTHAVMQELDIDLSGRAPKALSDITLNDYELIVTLTPQSKAAVEKQLAETVSCKTTKIPRLEYWPTHDPCDAEGSRDQLLDSYRRVRDQLEARIGDLFIF